MNNIKANQADGFTLSCSALNMMALLLAVFYFIAVKLDTDQKLRIMTGLS